MARSSPIHCIFLISILLFTSGCQKKSTSQGIVSIGPNITEIIFALQLESQLKGVGDYDDYPIETQNFPKVGSYLTPNLEKIAVLNPAIILTAGEIPALREFAHLHGISCHSIGMDTLEQVYAGILTIGEVTQTKHRAQKLIDEMKTELQRIQQLTQNFPPIPTLLVVGREPRDLSAIQVAGGKSFLSEILTIAGGSNVFENAEQSYFTTSPEQILVKAPEVIIEFRPGEDLTQRQLDALFLDWKSLENLPAVQKSRIFFVLESYGMRPGPRLTKLATKIATLLHPEIELQL